MKARLARLARQPGKQDFAFYSFPNKNYHVFIWTSGLARLVRSLLPG